MIQSDQEHNNLAFQRIHQMKIYLLTSCTPKKIAKNQNQNQKAFFQINLLDSLPLHPSDEVNQYKQKPY
jgi:hypothetical protein